MLHLHATQAEQMAEQTERKEELLSKQESMIAVIPIALVSSIAAVMWIHPRLVKIALMKNIVDKPNARKLQRYPVPVLGGVAVFFGIALGACIACSYAGCLSPLSLVAAMVIMLYTGTMDDILDLEPWLRLAIEVGVVLLLIFSSHTTINSLHSLWGVERIASVVAIPLTVVAAVGIINAINLVDGVNGLSSTLVIMASAAFGLLFYRVGDMPMLILATVTIGALLPFLFHNLFGGASKMFIGDGGTMVMGVVMASFVVNTLGYESHIVQGIGPSFGVVAFVLAVVAIPVFDTLRVMAGRLLRGTSPLRADRTHLHHLFLEMGYSHSGTTLAIVALNIVVVAAQWLAWQLGASIEVQLYIVVAMGIVATIGVSLVAGADEENSIKRAARAIGRATHFEAKGGFRRLQRLADRMQI